MTFRRQLKAHQLCGAVSGVEAAVHTVWNVFEDGDTEAVLWADASDAFLFLLSPVVPPHLT